MFCCYVDVAVGEGFGAFFCPSWECEKMRLERSEARLTGIGNHHKDGKDRATYHSLKSLP